MPEDGKGDDLLAMVSKPGEASRIITAPTPKIRDAVQVPDEGAPVDTASARCAA